MGKIFFLIMAIPLLFGSIAFAGGKYDAHFGDIDKNGDGVVVKEEFVEFFKSNDQPEEAFVIIDVDKSGNLDHDEWHKFKEAHGYKHKEGGEHEKKS